jgi:hypothetical protein
MEFIEKIENHNIPNYMIYFDMIKKVNEKDKQKKTFILNFINKLINKPILSLYNFKYVKETDFPSDNDSKKILLKYFELINLTFNLNLVYDENTFNRINLIELLRLMLKSIDVKLIKKTFNDVVNYSII